MERINLQRESAHLEQASGDVTACRAQAEQAALSICAASAQVLNWEIAR